VTSELRRRAAEAVARGAAFLAQVQRPDGEFPVYASTDPSLEQACVEDPSIFPTALIAGCLADCPEAEAPRRRALAFLRAEMDAHGLWRHWPRHHPHAAQLPPDLDDTACASRAVALAGEAFPDNRGLLLANRDARGLFYTWVAPRLAWTTLPHMRVALRQLAHAATLFLFFRTTSARPRDVDAVVNANALLHLGSFPGDAAVIAFLAKVVEQGRERDCDKWYEEPRVVRYFLARALAGRAPDAMAMLGSRLREDRPEGALHLALHVSVMRSCGEAPDPAAVERLLALQQDDGAWPRAALYHGGRRRLRGGGFAPPHPDTPRWGSEALTTGFCLEALAPLSSGGEAARPGAAAGAQAAG
jgi:hypothetical protein